MSQQSSESTPRVRQERTANGTPAGHRVTAAGRETIKVTGVEELISFDETGVVMKTSEGTLTVDGSGLNVTRLDLVGGEADIEGRLIGMYYVEPSERRSKRLFRRS